MIKVCPICKRRDIIWWGDSPCPQCQQQYARLKQKGKIPQGGDIWLWGKAREKGDAALAAGENLEEAQKITQAELQDLATKKLEDRAQSDALCGASAPDPRLDHLFD